MLGRQNGSAVDHRGRDSPFPQHDEATLEPDRDSLAARVKNPRPPIDLTNESTLNPQQGELMVVCKFESEGRIDKASIDQKPSQMNLVRVRAGIH
jgi:hypothetical protein